VANGVLRKIVVALVGLLVLIGTAAGCGDWTEESAYEKRFTREANEDVTVADHVEAYLDTYFAGSPWFEFLDEFTYARIPGSVEALTTIDSSDGLSAEEMGYASEICQAILGYPGPPVVLTPNGGSRSLPAITVVTVIADDGETEIDRCVK
jgi:hypothetical protein